MNFDMEYERTVAEIRELREELRRLCNDMAKTGSCIPHYDDEGRCIDLATGSDHPNHDATTKLQERISFIQEEIRLWGHIYSRGHRKETLIEYWKSMQKNPQKYQIPHDAALSIQTG
jgi:hypothetical protein